MESIGLEQLYSELHSHSHTCTTDLNEEVDNQMLAFKCQSDAF
jgi:hypothetical protein